MSKNRFMRLLSLVLTVCMLMGIFAGAVGAAEPAGAVTVDATASVSVTAEGHYPVEFILTNTSASDYSITLNKTAGDADFNYRGTSAKNGAITLASMSQQKISGYLSFTNAKNQLSDVKVEVRSGSSVLETVTIDVVDAISQDNVIRVATFDFEGSMQGWKGSAHYDAGTVQIWRGGDIYYNSQLKLIPGHLYRLTIRAKATENGGGVFARVSDYDKDGNALATPMSLNQLMLLTTSYQDFEYRFVANNTEDSTYFYSTLGIYAAGVDNYTEFRRGNAPIDSVVLVDCGEAEKIDVINGSFEQVTGDAVATFENWTTGVTASKGSVTGDCYNYIPTPVEGQEMMYASRDLYDLKYTAQTFDTDEEVTITYWSRSDYGWAIEANNVDLGIMEYTDAASTAFTTKTYSDKIRFDAWMSHQVTYTKPQNVEAFRFGMTFGPTAAKGNWFDHVTMYKTGAASAVTGIQIAGAEPIEGFTGTIVDPSGSSVSKLPTIAKPETSKVANSQTSLLAAAGGKVKLIADITVDAVVDAANVEFNGHRLILAEGARVSGAKEANLKAVDGCYLVNNGGVFTVKEIPAGSISHVGRSLSLEGVIYINQYVKMEGFEGVDIGKNGGLMVFRRPVTEEEATFDNADEVMEGLTKSGANYVQRTNGIAVKEYADELYLRVYVKDNRGKFVYSPLMQYSVREYCEGRLEKSTDSKMKRLAAAMLHYGASAQDYFDYNTGDMANANILSTWPATEYDPIIMTPLKEATTNVVSTGDVKVIGKSLSLDGAIKVNYYFEPNGSWKASEAELLVWDGAGEKLTLDNVSYTAPMAKEGSRWYGSSREFAAKEMGKTVYAAARFLDQNGEEHYSATVAYSPEAYAEGRMANSTNPKMVELAKRMVIYGEYAAIYFGVSDTPVKPPVQEEEGADQPVVDHPTISTPDDIAYGDYLVYENEPQAHIMLSENATELEHFAAEELQTHVEMVTGATLPMTVVEVADRAFSAYMEPADLYVSEIGYYPVEIMLKNPTSDALEVTLRQKTDTVEIEPVLTIRGDNGLDGVVSMAPYSQMVVSGHFAVEDIFAYSPASAVEVEVVANGTVIATMPMAFSATSSYVKNGGFEDAQPLWSGAAVDSSVKHQGAASLKVNAASNAVYGEDLHLVSGHLYHLGFYAMGAADTTVRATVSDFDAAGAALKTPMSLNTGEFVKNGQWTYHTVRFVANTTGDAAYAASKVSLQTDGSIWVDDLVLIDLGAAQEEPARNADFETYDYNASNRFPGWWLTHSAYEDVTDPYTGERGVYFDINPALMGYAGYSGLNKNSTYVMSFWAKAADSETTIKWTSTPWIANQATTNVEGETFALSTEWERYEFVFTTPEVAEGIKYNGVYLNFSVSGRVWMDHYRVHEIADALVVEEELGLGRGEAMNPGVEEMPAEPELFAPVYNGLTLFVVTPDSYPALEKLFPEDLDWLEGSDGFAVRQLGGTIYIFGLTAQAAQNGVYDFIEKNLGVIWFRADDIAYNEMTTVKPEAVNYREKSPLKVRSWFLGGEGDDGQTWSDPDTELMLRRNKLNSTAVAVQNADCWNYKDSMGFDLLYYSHNIYGYILDNQLYDPNDPELWCTDEEGNPLEEAWNPLKYQFNMWSEKTVDAVTEGVLRELRNSPVLKKYICVAQSDSWYTTCLPWSELPFEYEPGKFVYPDDYNYESTVFFTWLNKVAERVAEEFPDITITTLAYHFSERVPECDIADNILLIFAPIKENLKEPYFTTKEDPNNEIYRNLKEWKEKTTNMIFYNYYSCYTAAAYYERPVGERIQKDMQYYAEMGFQGSMPEGVVDSGSFNANAWAMNQLTYWLYQKFAWNPYEDLDALTDRFCTTVYGPKAGPYMREYYDLSKAAWDENDGRVYITDTTQEYLDRFIFSSGYVLDMQEALTNAWKAAEGVYKDRIQYIKETFDGVVMAASSLKIQEASALYTTAGKDAILAATDMSDPIWEGTQVLDNFYHNTKLTPVAGAETSARILWDEDYVYVAYEMFDDTIENIRTTTSVNPGTNWWNGKTDDVETYLTIDPSFESYFFYASTPTELSIRYRFENGFRRHDPSDADWTCKSKIYNEEGTENDRWVLIQAISWDSLGLTGNATKDTEVFGYFYHEHFDEADESNQIAWNGATVWTAKYLRQIELRTEPYVDDTPDEIIPDVPDINA